MADHLPILPVLIPLTAAILLLALSGRGIETARTISLGSMLLVAGASVMLLIEAASGTVTVYVLGNWTPPFGIVLVADRLSATMVAVTSAVALPALIAAAGGTDTKGKHFHVLYQFQIAGINGAFLTGDIFNLFVFFEVLLIASYGLLVHGGGTLRSRAGLHYVVLNLTGSTLFLFALALIYGIAGTLNMADLGVRIAQLPDGDQALIRTAFTLLGVVFALKAALLPLSFWLPHAYSAATPPIAALFAVMTKVGVYALLRVSTIALDGSSATAGLWGPWLIPLGFATIVMGLTGMLAAQRLSVIVANFVLVSTGTLTFAIGLGGAAILAGVIFYLPNTILATAALFLMTGQIAAGRGILSDELQRGEQIARLGFIGMAYLILGVAITGLPPLSGFFGKVMLMTGSPENFAGYLNWAGLILSGFVGALVLARAASVLFWEPAGTPAGVAPSTATRPEVLGFLLALTAVPALTVAAAPVAAYAQAAANQLSERQPYLGAVIPDPAAVARGARP
jgi:multicomponent K+:H+ antiporter subunit D